MFYLDLIYREMEEWLLASDRVCSALELACIPDHSTLERTFKKLQQRNFDQLNTQLVSQLKVAETAIAVESTGFIPRRKRVTTTKPAMGVLTVNMSKRPMRSGLTRN